MALVDGEFNNIGDVFILELDPMFKVVSINGFDETTVNETVDRTFTREFRYSRDDYNFTAWAELTDIALQAIIATAIKPYYFEIRYTRSGTEASGVLELDYFQLDVTTNENFNTTLYPTVFTKPNVFGDIEIDNPDFVELCANLLDKVVKYGIVPKFISDENTGDRTDDYKEYWKAICCYLALHYVFAKQFSEIYDRQELLVEYLRQRGVYLCGTETLLELQGLASNYYSEIKKRGTTEADAEIRRLLCVEDCDEFIFAYVPSFKAGWIVDNASPLYKGLSGIETLDKMPEQTDDVIDKANYYLLNAADVDIVSDTKNNGDAVEVFHIDSVSGTTGVFHTGGGTDLLMTVEDSAISADVQLNYEISFYVKQEVLGSILSFGVKGYDENNVEIVSPFEEMVGGTDESYFFRVASVINQTSEYVQVRGLIFNKDETLRTADESLLNIGYGANLRFKAGVCKIYPTIVVEDGISVPSNSTKIYGVRVALISAPYSLGIVALNNWVITYFDNKNPELTNEEVDKIVDKYLIPLNSTINTVQLS